MVTKEELIKELEELRAKEKEEIEMAVIKKELSERKHPIRTNILRGFKNLAIGAGNSINKFGQKLNKKQGENAKRRKSS